MLFSELIYNVKNLMSGGITSDDLNIRDKQIAFWINYYRAKLLKQAQDKRDLNFELYKQNLGSVDVDLFDKNECCEIDDCILRTKIKIPSPLETGGGLNITFVGLLDGTPFNKEYHNSVMWSSASKCTSKTPTWYYQGGYIYIVNHPQNLKYINIQGVFENPLEANNFRTCDCDDLEDCFDDYDFQYPFPEHKVDTLVKMIAESELRILTGLPKDNTNDSQDTLVDPSKK